VALAVGEHRTVVVVCDGVSSTTDSDVAALAAARAARDVLQVAPAAPSELEPRAEHWRSQFTAAARAAQDAAAAAAATARIGNVEDPPSCTFVAAVIDEPLVASAWIGDSRAYWFADAGTAIQLSVDDSWASGEIAGGVARDVAEADPRAHSITRWLGVDSPGGDPSYTSIISKGPGWLMVCSDGLWNYCSDAAALRDLTLEHLTDSQNDPLVAAGALVAWANAQGGHDNVTVALARVFETTSATVSSPDVTPATRSM
jgi:serine/threonine protein phosphatase PrpC